MTIDIEQAKKQLQTFQKDLNDLQIDFELNSLLFKIIKLASELEILIDRSAEKDASELTDSELTDIFYSVGRLLSYTTALMSVLGCVPLVTEVRNDSILYVIRSLSYTGSDLASREYQESVNMMEHSCHRIFSICLRILDQYGLELDYVLDVMRNSAFVTFDIERRASMNNKEGK